MLMDRLVQRTQELADLYLRVLEIESDAPKQVRDAYEADLLQAYARHALVYSGATSAITARFLTWENLASVIEEAGDELQDF